MANEQEAMQSIKEDPLDLSKFSKIKIESLRDAYKVVKAAEDYLWKVCNNLKVDCNKTTVENLSEAVNPVKFRCVRLEMPSINSHGQLELWVADPDTFDFKEFAKKPKMSFRSMEDIPRGAILCIDTKDIFPSPDVIRKNPYMFLGSTLVYGNVRSAIKEKVHLPGWGCYFIELGAISYSDVGNSWTVGVYGKGFGMYSRSEK